VSALKKPNSTDHSQAQADRDAFNEQRLQHSMSLAEEKTYWQGKLAAAKEGSDAYRQAVNELLQIKSKEASESKSEAQHEISEPIPSDQHNLGTTFHCAWRWLFADIEPGLSLGVPPFLAHPLPSASCVGKELSITRTQGVSPKARGGGISCAEGTLDDAKPKHCVQGLRNHQTEMPHARRMAQKMVCESHWIDQPT